MSWSVAVNFFGKLGTLFVGDGLSHYRCRTSCSIYSSWLEMGSWQVPWAVLWLQRYRMAPGKRFQDATVQI
jgi:hypothetical protein